MFGYFWMIMITCFCSNSCHLPRQTSDCDSSNDKDSWDILLRSGTFRFGFLNEASPNPSTSQFHWASPFGRWDVRPRPQSCQQLDGHGDRLWISCQSRWKTLGQSDAACQQAGSEDLLSSTFFFGCLEIWNLQDPWISLDIHGLPSGKLT